MSAQNTDITPFTPKSAYELLHCLGFSKLEIEIYRILSTSNYMLPTYEVTQAVNNAWQRGASAATTRRTTVHRAVTKLERIGFVDSIRVVWIIKYTSVPINKALPALHNAQRRTLDPLYSEQQRVASKQHY